MFRLGLFLFCCLCSGCLIVQTGVTNPVPGLTTVAVAPFINHSTEPNLVVDGRRFAIAYSSELQKVPGFEVVPVGVTETAMAEYEIDLSSPDDALRLARLLDVDAIVVGAVTEYDPYYPPRIGLHVEWVSPYPWGFLPSLPVHVQSDDCEGESCRNVEPQIPEAGRATELALPGTLRAQSPAPPLPLPEPADGFLPPILLDPQRSEKADRGSTAGPHPSQPLSSGSEPAILDAQTVQPAWNFDPTEPLMAYSRIFDGTDADLLATLRDYVELNGDLRSGGWQAYLHRSDDFIRFAAHRMIVEMLTLHGGEGRRRIVVKWRKHK